MTEPEQEPMSLYQWEFDSFSICYWDEQKQGNIDATKSWVEIFETDGGQKLTIFVNREPILSIDAERDMWGTWITFLMGNLGKTVAQEDQTMSFVDALIAALTKFKQITDIETEAPKFTDNQAQSLAKLFEAGVITDYELCSKLRDFKLEVPEKYLEKYNTFLAEHPVVDPNNSDREVITASIVA